jgi:hypothetical protein
VRHKAHIGKKRNSSKFWWVIPREGDHLEDPDKDFILLYFKNGIGGQRLDYLAQDRDKWWACVNMVRCREILDQLRNYHCLKNNSDA